MTWLGYIRPSRLLYVSLGLDTDRLTLEHHPYSGLGIQRLRLSKLLILHTTIVQDLEGPNRTPFGRRHLIVALQPTLKLRSRPVGSTLVYYAIKCSTVLDAFVGFWEEVTESRTARIAAGNLR